MTNYLHKTLIVVCLLAITISGCKKSDDDSSGNEPVANRFYCEIDGVPFHTSGNFSCDALLFSFAPNSEPSAGDGYTVIRGRHCPSNKSVGIRLFGQEPRVGSFDMIEPTFADSCSPFVRVRDNPGQSDLYEELISGTLRIEEMYPRNENNTDEFGRISGTFEFEVRLGENGDTLSVLNGSFHFRVGSFW